MQRLHNLPNSDSHEELTAAEFITLLELHQMFEENEKKSEAYYQIALMFTLGGMPIANLPEFKSSFIQDTKAHASFHSQYDHLINEHSKVAAAQLIHMKASKTGFFSEKPASPQSSSLSSSQELSSSFSQDEYASEEYSTTPEEYRSPRMGSSSQ